MNFSKIKETCIYVHDLERIREFYENVLSLPVISSQPGKHLFIKVGTSVLLFFNPEESRTKKTPPAHYGGGKQHFAFEVKSGEYQSTKNQLEAKGVSITQTVIWPSGVESFYFEDPEGHILEVVPEVGIWD